MIAEAHFRETDEGVDEMYCEIATRSTTTEKNQDGFSMSECPAYTPVDVSVAREGDQAEQPGLYESVAL